jgi:hypothetical protein
MARPGDEEPPSAGIGEQADIVKEFLVGLLDAFGLEGEVTTRLDGDIYADVSGDQTEALIGPGHPRRWVVPDHGPAEPGRSQRRLDIGGYGPVAARLSASMRPDWPPR